MNWSMRKPTSCSAVPGSSPSGPAHYTTLLPFPLSFPSLPFLSSSFLFSFLLPFRFYFLPVSIFFSLLFWFPLLYPCTPSLPFPFSIFPFFFFLFLFHPSNSFPTQIGVGSSGGDTCSHVSTPHSFPHA